MNLVIRGDSAELSHRGLTTSAPFAPDPVGLAALASDPDAYGRALGDALFSPAIATLWQSARLSTDAPLSVRLHLHAWRDLVWERLHAPSATGWRAVAVDPATPLARVIGSQTLRPLPTRTWPGRILSAVASPSAHGLPPLSAELGHVSIDHWHTETLQAATPGSLREWLTHRPDILHLAAHGVMLDDDSYLMLCDDHGRPAPISSDTLAAIITETAAPGLVVLLACDSARSSQAHQAIGARLVEAGMDAVIGMNAAISLDAAAIFSRVLYARLSDGDPLDAACNAARAALRAGYDWSAPTLALRMDEQPTWTRPHHAPAGVTIQASTGGAISIGGHVIAGDVTITHPD